MEAWTVEEVEREAGDAEAGLEDGTDGTDIDTVEATDRRSVVSMDLLLSARENLVWFCGVGGHAKLPTCSLRVLANSLVIRLNSRAWSVE